MLEGRLGMGKYGYLGQWCVGAGAINATCKPSIAQVVLTTTTARTIVIGTGMAGPAELLFSSSFAAPDALTEPLVAPIVLSGRTRATHSQGTRSTGPAPSNEWQSRSNGAPLVYSHLFHGETYDATLETYDGSELPGGGWGAVTLWDTGAYPMGELTPHDFPAVRISEAAVPVADAWVPYESGAIFN